MRFLLNANAASKRATSKVKISKTINTTNALASTVDGGVTSSWPPASVSQQHATVKKAWGQQCSPTCGCVVRFEGHTNTTTGHLESVTYHAKQVVTSRRPNGELVVQRTKKGRPMVQDCSCQTLHHLSQATMRHMLQSGSLAKFQQFLSFQKTRSSPAFVRSVLHAQNLPPKDTHCVDVVEEALTALCKGHLPARRKAPVLSSVASHGPLAERRLRQDYYLQSKNHQSSQSSNAQIQRYLDQEDEEEDEEGFLKFGHGWRDDDEAKRRNSDESTWMAALLDALEILPVKERPSPPITNSAAAMVDASMPAVAMEEVIQREANDWVSYVDELQQSCGKG